MLQHYDFHGAVVARERDCGYDKKNSDCGENGSEKSLGKKSPCEAGCPSVQGGSGKKICSEESSLWGI